MILQETQTGGIDGEGAHDDPMPGVELDVVQSSACDGNLVLGSDIVAAHLAFDVDRFRRELHRFDPFAPQCVESMEQPNGES